MVRRHGPFVLQWHVTSACFHLCFVCPSHWKSCTDQMQFLNQQDDRSASWPSNGTSFSSWFPKLTEMSQKQPGFKSHKRNTPINPNMASWRMMSICHCDCKRLKMSRIPSHFHNPCECQSKTGGMCCLIIGDRSSTLWKRNFHWNMQWNWQPSNIRLTELSTNQTQTTHVSDKLWECCVFMVLTLCRNFKAFKLSSRMQRWFSLQPFMWTLSSGDSMQICNLKVNALLEKEQPAKTAAFLSWHCCWVWISADLWDLTHAKSSGRVNDQWRWETCMVMFHLRKNNM